jgi:hypothetical protein
MAHADYSNATIGGLEVNGRLDCLSTPYAQAVAEGSIPNHDAFSKIAYNGTAGTAEVDIWSKTGLYAFPAAATAMFVSSTDNTNDKAAGSGAQEVKIIYLDANYALGTATVIPNGTALVSAGTFLRVNEVYVSAAGTLSKASGAISVTSAAGAATYGFITAGFTVARSSIYTVPAGKILNVTDLHGSWAHTSALPEYG